MKLCGRHAGFLQSHSVTLLQLPLDGQQLFGNIYTVDRNITAGIDARRNLERAMIMNRLLLTVGMLLLLTVPAFAKAPLRSIEGIVSPK